MATKSQVLGHMSFGPLTSGSVMLRRIIPDMFLLCYRMLLSLGQWL